ncbi:MULTISPECIES: AAA family ATPase [unclassified Sphingomonas]|uniref:AAA family ATPase n=1 Tax=unclassified Sphingomonas TaxID=196159 RepID=UPI000AE06B9C|nr:MULTISPECIES: hypothetical protein [unclassified Sphingomonas]
MFVAPPWRGISTGDTERRQDFAEAKATHAAMTDIYASLGYGLVPLPLAPVPERVRFVRTRIGG